MIKNEIEILPLYYRYIKKWCKKWKVLDHGSDDGSIEFLEAMKKRGEIDIEVFHRPSDDFGHDFYGEFNWIIDKSDCEWTYVGHIDEICPIIEFLLPKMLENKFAYFFRRENLVSLYPVMTLGKETPFMRLFPTKASCRFVAGNHVHSENADVKGIQAAEADIPYFHLGECRNIDHVKEKEKAYEDCSGSTIFTSKWDKEKRKQRRKGAYAYQGDEYALSELMDMIL